MGNPVNRSIIGAGLLRSGVQGCRVRIFPGFWQRRFLFYEGLLVAALGAVSIAYGYRYGGNHVIDVLLGDTRGMLYGSLAAIFASLFGFVIAATSIILGLSNSPRLAVVRESDSYGDLWKLLFSAIRWTGVAALVALGALILDTQDSPTFWVAHAALVVTAMAVVRLWRCVWVLEETIKLVTRKPFPKAGDKPAEGATRPRSGSTQAR